VASGVGTRALTGMPMPGFVPYVTIGSSVEASSVIVWSYVAPGSLGRVRQ
jgi:hypothetical protein